MVGRGKEVGTIREGRGNDKERKWNREGKEEGNRS